MSNDSLNVTKNLRRGALTALRSWGVFNLVRDSRWRQNRLLILCYHGISQEDEHLWRPGLYMQASVFQQRLEILKRGGYNVLSLSDGLRKLEEGGLPNRSVVLTFDDGGYDFYQQAYPLLQNHGFPATVYLTTYYSDYQTPIFNLVCSYMLWKRRGTIFQKGSEIGIAGPSDLTTELNRHRIVRQLIDLSEAEKMSGRQKDELATRLAQLLDIDYAALKQRRFLQIMTANEVAELASKGVDFQLHTHRHRVPLDEQLFRKEIDDNKVRIRASANSEPVHFCYPSGVYRQEFLDWLKKEEVASATTCDVGLVTKATNKLLLPRFVDTYDRTEVEFESWLSGIGSLIAMRRVSTQTYQPPKD